MNPEQRATAAAYSAVVKTLEARVVLQDLVTYVHSLPETLQLGASHLLNHIQYKAYALDRDRRRTKEPRHG